MNPHTGEAATPSRSATVAIVVGSDPDTDRDGVADYVRNLCSALDRASAATGSRGEGTALSVDALVLKPRNVARGIRHFRRLFRSYDLVNIHYPSEGWGVSAWPPAVISLLALLPPRTKLVATFHEWRSMHPLRRMSILPLAMAADAAIFTSRTEEKAFRRHWAARHGRRKSVVATIPATANAEPPPIDPATAFEHRRALLTDGPPADRLIGFFGVLYESKQPLTLLRTVEQLHQGGVRARLIIAGDFAKDHGRQKRAFLQAIDQLGIRDFVSMLGHIESIDKVGAVLAACDAVLLPYLDGLSARRGTFWYSLSLGVPLVTTAPLDTTEFEGLLHLQDLAERGQLVLIPTPGSAKEFAEAVSTVRPWDLSRANKEAVPLFGDISRRYARLYQEVLDDAREPGVAGAARPA